MKSKEKMLVFLILSTFLLISSETLGRFYVRSYSDIDGLSMNIGSAIVQDRMGYIWIATQEGLNRFDGVDFKIFTKKDKMINDFINHLLVDKNGILWIASRGGLIKYEDGKFVNYSLKDGLIDENVTYLKESKRYGLLIGTEKGLCYFDGKKFVDMSSKNRLHELKILTIEVNDTKNQIYLGTPQNGLIIFENGIAKEFNKKNGSLKSNYVDSLLLDKNVGLWIGTNIGLALLKDDKIKNETSFPFNKPVRALYKDHKKDILLVGTSDGLYQRKGNDFLLHPKSNCFEGNHILSFCLDSEDGLWIGTYGGVSYLTRSKFTIYNSQDGLPKNDAFGIYQANDGKIWVATYGGIAVIDDRDKNNVEIKTYTCTNRNDLPSNTIRTICGDKKGNIWIGSFGGGLTRYKNDSFTSYTTDNGLPNNNVRIVYVDSKGNLWLGMQDGGLILFDSENYKVKMIYNAMKEPELLNNNVWFIKEDSKENLWIGVDGGLSKLNLNSWKFNGYSKEDGLVCKDTQGILEDENGYWIATFGAGLYFFNEKLPKGEQFKQYTTEEELPSNCVYGVVSDKKGQLWLPTNNGICCWNKKKKLIHHYTADNALPSNENNAHGGIKDRWGRIWFSSPRGVVCIDPENISLSKFRPPVFIEEVKINHEKINYIQKSLILTKNQNNIYIKFAAIGHRYPEAVKFKVRLTGFPGKDVWEKPRGKNRFVEYTNLPPGNNYTFQVKACNSDDQWNEEGASLSFYIKPSFFQTPWFYILLGLIVIILGYGLPQYRIAWQRKQQRRLRKMVKERTRELEEAQVQLIQQGKMASLGEMAAGLAHEMNNPANYIYGNIDFLQKFINEIKTVLTEYMKIELPADHKVNMMRKDLAIDNKLRELEGLIKYVKEGAVRIAEIVMNLRYFVGKGKDESAPEPTNIHKNIETTLNLLHNKTKEKIEIKIKFGKIPSIECYPSQLNQVFMNILSNAADSIKDKGNITIETMNEEDRNVIIKISDTGEGIAPGNLSRIYEPFFTTKDREKGMGLGLTITRKIIERHRGTINVKSEKGKGTTFTITLPIKYSDLKSEGDSKKWERMAISTKS